MRAEQDCPKLESNETEMHSLGLGITQGSVTPSNGQQMSLSDHLRHA